ncbi:IS256 family transposase [Bacillus andreraoultii]|uniref:IS256 family transposase n=1 Tax=Bacillus andreraoultii TaxID=1499685 RepID=UPI00053A6DDC|nr:IS256 family transposase [Bacillus andreraoultii]
MTQLQLTLNLEDLKVDVVNSNLNEVMKASLVLVLNQLMEQQRDDYIQALPYERTEGRTGHRNGYYDRSLTVSIGNLELKVPRTRDGQFSPTLFEKWQRKEQSFVLSMLEMVVNGVSTRKVKKVVKQLCGEEVSKSFISGLTEKLDAEVNKWAGRPLNVMYYKYIFTDAMYIKVREHNRVVSKAVYIAVGVNKQNKREIIGLKVSHAESKAGWNEFFAYLKARGLQSPSLIISDAHEGQKNAIRESFIGTTWQRCTFHFKKNLKDAMPKKGSKEVMDLIKDIFDAPGIKEARKLKEQFMETYEEDSLFSKAAKLLDEGFEDAIQFFNEPKSYRKSLRTTNNLERINQEVRRRDRVIRIYPNNQSAFRLIGAVLMDIEETLDSGGKKFLN